MPISVSLPTPGTAGRAGRQIDRDAAGGIRVDRPVKAEAAIEQIVAAKPLQPIVAVKAEDAVDLTGADQHVIGGRAGDAVVARTKSLATRLPTVTFGSVMVLPPPKSISVLAALLGRTGLDVGKAEDTGHPGQVDPVALAVVEVADEVGTAAVGVDKRVRTRPAVQDSHYRRAPLMVSLPPLPNRKSLPELPVMVSSKFDPRTLLTPPVMVSVPTEASPVAVPVVRLTVHAGRGVAVLDLGTAVAGDGVVAALTLERVERRLNAEAL